MPNLAVLVKSTEDMCSRSQISLSKYHETFYIVAHTAEVIETEV